MLLRTAVTTKQDAFCGKAFTAHVIDTPVASQVEACRAIAVETITLLFSNRNGYSENAAAPLCDDFIKRNDTVDATAKTILTALKRYVGMQQQGNLRAGERRGRASFTYNTTDGVHEGDHAEAEVCLRYYPDGYDTRHWHVETPL
jgi:hypothetical protein